MVDVEAKDASTPVTPDGRYFVVRGRLWRCANPALPEAQRRRLVTQLMTARRAVAAAQRTGSASELTDARASVDQAKRGLGERGPVWWADGAPDYNRHLARNTPYAEWLAALTTGVGASAAVALNSPGMSKAVNNESPGPLDG